MMSRRREQDLERGERRQKRLAREAAAERLLVTSPRLLSLSIAIHETRPEGCVSDTHYIRRVPVEHAPALFEVACSDPHCQDGGYDVTRTVCAALRAQLTHFEGDQACHGHSAVNDCARVLRYVADATYGAAPA